MPELYAKKVVMPDLIGLNILNANTLLVNGGFTASKVHYVESYEPDNNIVHQDPPKGHLVDRNTQQITVYVAKQSLIQFLPSVYQATSGLTKENFLKEFLWIFTHLFESVTNKINLMHDYFNPLETREEFLPWLADWLALELDANWDVNKKRATLRRASGFYLERGTAKYLVRMIHLFTGLSVTVIENQWPYKGFCIGVFSAVGIDTIILPPMNLANCFMIEVPLAPEDISQELLTKLHRVINDEKPAHTAYFLKFTPPDEMRQRRSFMRIGMTDATAIGLKAVDADYDEL